MRSRFLRDVANEPLAQPLENTSLQHGTHGVNHTVAETLARYRLGFYPYFDRDQGVFYWDRAAARSILVLSASMEDRARSLAESDDSEIVVLRDDRPHRVIDNLADEALRPTTWVKGEVEDIYRGLVEAGYGHTLGAYDRDGALVGGLFYVRIGRAIIAETMYRRRSGASRKCLHQLVLDCRRLGAEFIDVQVSHKRGHPVHRLGETTVTLDEYLKLLDKAAGSDWPRPNRDLRTYADFPASGRQWANQHASTIEHPHGSTLLIAGFQAMQSWERPLMERMAQSITDAGSAVLEIGYGLGISAGCIQARRPRLHVIVEANHRNAAMARERYAKQVAAGMMVIIDEFWQSAVETEEFMSLAPDGYDGILFDASPVKPEEIHRAKYDFFTVVDRLLVPGGRFTYFSDEVSSLSEEHSQALSRIVRPARVETSVVEVRPSPDCEYWSAPTILHVVAQR